MLFPEMDGIVPGVKWLKGARMLSFFSMKELCMLMQMLSEAGRSPWKFFKEKMFCIIQNSSAFMFEDAIMWVLKRLFFLVLLVSRMLCREYYIEGDHYPIVTLAISSPSDGAWF